MLLFSNPKQRSALLDFTHVPLRHIITMFYQLPNQKSRHFIRPRQGRPNPRIHTTGSTALHPRLALFKPFGLTHSNSSTSEIAQPVRDGWLKAVGSRRSVLRGRPAGFNQIGAPNAPAIPFRVIPCFPWLPFF